MSDKIVDAVIERAYYHCKKQGIKEFLFAFHGGEPMLQKKKFYEEFVKKCESVFRNEVRLYYTIQTNGTLITQEWARLFSDLKIQVGISIDGAKDVNDLNRLYKNNKSSFEDVIQGIDNAFKYDFHQKTLGVLSVINMRNDPVSFYNFLKGLSVKNVDFLFPYNNFNNLPEGYTPNNIHNTPFADWLIKMFEYWYHDDNQINIRMFNGFIECLFGNEYPTDLFGNFENGLLVIESNGEIEAVDYLKACGDNFTKTGLNVLRNNLHESTQSELIKLYYKSHRELNNKCLTCPVSEICGGGNLTSRYSLENGFDNPSFLCYDFLKLITHIQNKVYQELPESIIKQYDLDISSFEEVIKNEIKEDNSKKFKNKYLQSFKQYRYEY